ncbi:hypothetical protein [Corallococcus sp. 4LFB]|uniref:hypothetical protein n=1 Tax=Corallococcus sp. 4LFB TaxID=3383249 RepID=UPI00397645DF
MRLSPRSLLLVTCLLAGCRTAREAPSTPAKADCGPVIPGMEAVLKPAAFVVLGEIHGTQEAPAFAARLRVTRRRRASRCGWRWSCRC